MTKKHFEAIARMLANHPANKSAEIRSLGWELADYFGSINPNFDRARFLTAANIYPQES